MLPDFAAGGLLPPGIHEAGWHEIVSRFGRNSQRHKLLAGLRRVLKELQRAGCQAAYLDGSFVTSKEQPGDYDLCWSVVGVDPSKLDPVLLDFSAGRAAMKAKYLGDIFPEGVLEADSHRRFLDFFQVDKLTGDRKGIVRIDLRRFS